MRLVFDRGTLLLLDARPSAASGIGPAGLRWDPRVAAWRAPASRHAELTNTLARAGAVFTDEARKPSDRVDGWSSIDLRPYQDAALAAWELSGRSGVVVLPTGAGKTRVALAAMARSSLPTLCLVPTRVLLEQWVRDIAAVWPHPVGVLGDGRHDLRPVTVATIESAYRWASRIGNRFDLVVVDEAHHFGAGMRDETLEMLTAPARLGLTATPPRDEDQAARLADLVGPVVYELGVADLAGRFLAPLDVVALRLDLAPAERERYDALMTTFRRVHTEFRRLAPDAAWEDFARFAARTPAGRAALDAFRRARQILAFPDAKRAALRDILERHRDARTLVFTSDNTTAYAIAREHLIMPLTCDIGRQERALAIERFRAGELRALVSARVLNEGVDVPDADVAVIVGGTLGEREHVQRIGRLLRPAPGKRALVYELIMRGTTETKQAYKRRLGLAPRNHASP